MEGGLPNTSNLPHKADRRQAFLHMITVIFRTLVLSILCGALAYILTTSLPYQRIVVYNQPTSTAVKVASAKLTKPGFIVIYMQDEGGWSVVNSSWLLPAGYYRDIVIDIGYHGIDDPFHKDNVTGNFQHRNFVARLYEYRGSTKVFDESIDMPVMNRNGRVYQKRFWFEPYGHPLRHFFLRLTDAPIVYLWDVLWP